MTALEEDSVMYVLTDTTVANRLVPRPTLEGYLYPPTYTFPLGLPLDRRCGGNICGLP